MKTLVGIALAFMVFGVLGIYLSNAQEYMADADAQAYLDNKQIPPHQTVSQQQFNLSFGVGSLIIGVAILVVITIALLRGSRG